MLPNRGLQGCKLRLAEDETLKTIKFPRCRREYRKHIGKNTSNRGFPLLLTNINSIGGAEVAQGWERSPPKKFFLSPSLITETALSKSTIPAIFWIRSIWSNSEMTTISHVQDLKNTSRYRGVYGYLFTKEESIFFVFPWKPRYHECLRFRTLPVWSQHPACAECWLRDISKVEKML